MTPGTYSFKVYRGDIYRLQIKLWQDAAKLVPVNLASFTMRAQVRAVTGLLLASFTLTTTLPNIINATLPPSESAKLAAGSAVWDLQLTDSNGDVLTPLGGTITVTEDVTL